MTDLPPAEQPALPARVGFPFENAASALRGDITQSPFYLPLNGDWRIHWAAGLAALPDDFYQETFADIDWEIAPVPADLALPTGEAAPVACLRTSLSLPEGWARMQVWVRFAGIGAPYVLWCNGKSVGESTATAGPVEFNLTDFIHTGTNQLTLVLKPDLAAAPPYGVFGDVTLWSGPYVSIREVQAQASLDAGGRSADVQLQVSLLNSPKAALASPFVEAELYDSQGQPVRWHTSARVQVDSGAEKSLRLGAKFELSQPAAQPNPYVLLMRLRSDQGKTLQVLRSELTIG